MNLTFVRLYSSTFVWPVSASHLISAVATSILYLMILGTGLPGINSTLGCTEASSERIQSLHTKTVTLRWKWMKKVWCVIEWWLRWWINNIYHIPHLSHAFPYLLIHSTRHIHLKVFEWVRAHKFEVWIYTSLKCEYTQVWSMNINIHRCEVFILCPWPLQSPLP
jgi:hypothetical protein